MATVSIYVNQEQAAFVVRELKDAISTVGYPQPSAMLYIGRETYDAIQLAVEFLEEAAKK